MTVSDRMRATMLYLAHKGSEREFRNGAILLSILGAFSPCGRLCCKRKPAAGSGAFSKAKMARTQRQRHHAEATYAECGELSDLMIQKHKPTDEAWKEARSYLEGFFVYTRKQ